MSRRFSSGLSPGCSAGGIFSVALSVTQLESTVTSDSATKNVPWRYQARCPTPLARIRCPDFPPAAPSSTLRRTQGKPAIVPLTRQVSLYRPNQCSEPFPASGCSPNHKSDNSDRTRRRSPYGLALRRVSTTLRQVLMEFSELFMCAGPAY